MSEKKNLKVFNLGTNWFLKSVEEQNVQVYDIEWSPPAKIEKDISSILKKLGRK